MSDLYDDAPTLCPECGARFFVQWHETFETTDGPEFCPFCGNQMAYRPAEDDDD